MRSLLALENDIDADALEGFAALKHAGRVTDPVLLNARAKAKAVRPFTWFLEQVADEGIKLTEAGYLPPATVNATMTELGWADDWPGQKNREIQTRPVLELRHHMTTLGLLRKRKGLLVPTRAGTALTHDPAALWDFLAAAISTGLDESELRATTFLLLGVATRRYHSGDAYSTLVSDGLFALGWTSNDDRPVTHFTAHTLTAFAWSLLKKLGAFERPTDEFGLPEAGVGTVVGAAFARQALTAPDPYEDAGGVAG